MKLYAGILIVGTIALTTTAIKAGRIDVTCPSPRDIRYFLNEKKTRWETKIEEVSYTFYGKLTAPKKKDPDHPGSYYHPYPELSTNLGTARAEKNKKEDSWKVTCTYTFQDPSPWRKPGIMDFPGLETIIHHVKDCHLVNDKSGEVICDSK